MGVRILHGDRRRGYELSVLYCSTTGWAFGPVFPSAEHAEAFLDWFAAGHATAAARALGVRPVQPLGDGTDPRHWEHHHLEALHREWAKTQLDDDGELLPAEPAREVRGVDLDRVERLERIYNARRARKASA